MKIIANESGILVLGRTGENDARTIVFDVSCILNEFPGATFGILNKRNGDTSAYPVSVGNYDLIGTNLEWTIKATDTSAPGEGACEIVAYKGEVVVKTIIFTTRVYPSLDGSGTTPEPWEDWYDDFVTLAGTAEEAERGAVAAQEAASGSASSANTDALKAEGYAVGTQDGTAVVSGTYFHNNSKYYSDGASEAKTIAVESKEAAQSAQTAQAKAEEAQGKAETAQGKAEDAQTAAETAQGKAEDAADLLENCSASATTLEPGESATASYNNGVFTFGIPEGEKGDTGEDGQTPNISISTVQSGQSAGATITGATPDLTLNLTLPKGDTGDTGATGTTFTPSVSSAGVISWSNDGGKQNPESVDIAAAVRSAIVESVTGTTPSITGVDNHRYICGEVSTISITPPSSGLIDVRFTSGSTPAVLTVPNSVKFPAWFDATNLEANVTYEMSFCDEYGAVMAWAT